MKVSPEIKEYIQRQTSSITVLRKSPNQQGLGLAQFRTRSQQILEDKHRRNAQIVNRRTRPSSSQAAASIWNRLQLLALAMIVIAGAAGIVAASLRVHLIVYLSITTLSIGVWLFLAVRIGVWWYQGDAVDVEFVAIQQDDAKHRMQRDS